MEKEVGETLGGREKMGVHPIIKVEEASGNFQTVSC